MKRNEVRQIVKLKECYNNSKEKMTKASTNLTRRATY